MRPFKEQWASLPDTRKREAKLASLCLLIGAAWVAGSLTRAEPKPVIIQPGYFVCVTGVGQPTAMFPDVLTATPKEADGLIHWSLIVKDYGELLFIQSPGEACKVKPITPATRQTRQEAARPKPQFTL